MSYATTASRPLAIARSHRGRRGPLVWHPDPPGDPVGRLFIRVSADMATHVVRKWSIQ